MITDKAYQKDLSINSHWRLVRSSLACIESLERTLTIDLTYLARIDVIAANAKAEYVHLVNSVAMLAEEGLKAQANLSNLYELLKVTQCNDITDKLSKLLVHHPIGSNFLRHSSDTGGFVKLLERTIKALEIRCVNYHRSYKLLVDPLVLGSSSKVPVGVLALRVGDILPPRTTKDGDSGVAESVGCLAGPWALLACVAIATVVLIAVDEGEAEGEDENDEELGDYPVPEPGGDQPA
jgi:hypothetical protein